MSTSGKICFWQCSEYNVNFSYILNAIKALKKRKISANFTNLLDKLNAGDELTAITEDLLKEILDYSFENKCISTHTYNANISYRINEKDIVGECNQCGEKLELDVPEKYPAQETVQLVDRNTFESLAEEVQKMNLELNPHFSLPTKVYLNMMMTGKLRNSVTKTIC